MSHSFRLAVLLLGLLLPGCLSVQSHRSAGPHDIHHHTWWNYYRRGRLYLKENKFAEAEHDFKTALGRIPGARYPYAEERWRIRTYGLHMMEGYFPHRELGICLLELGRPDEALKLLETSMEMEPSARAKFYINRIRKEQAVATAPPPTLHLSALPGWTADRELTITGTAIASNAVADLIINDEPEFIELADSKISFSRTLQLHEGQNTIRITATDLNGKQTATNLTVTADWSPPQISLHRTGGRPTVTCYDSKALGEVRINGIAVSFSGNTLTVPVDPSAPLQLSAADRAGNRIDWSLSKKERAHLAQNNPPAPPALQVAGEGKTITLFVPEYALDLRAADDTALRSVRVNGTELLTRSSPLFRSLTRISLRRGTNRLALTTEDTDGNRTEKTVTVVYRPPEYLDRIYRLAASLEPLSGELARPGFEENISHLISRELTQDPVRFYLLASDDEKQILHKERNLSDSELADPRAALNRSRQLNADLALVPRILRDGNGQTVYARILNTETGEELFIEDIYLENPDQLAHQIAGLIMKIEQRFPLVRARLAENRGRLMIDAGSRTGTQESMKFLVIRSESSFEQGRVLQAGERPVELAATKVESDKAQVIILRKPLDRSVQSGDYVFSR